MRRSLFCTLLSGLRFHPCVGKNTAPAALSRDPWRFRVLKILSSHHLRPRIPMAFLVSCSMADYLNISDFLSPVDLSEISADEYREGQIGRMASIYGGHGDTLIDEIPDIDDVQIVLIGCGEQRGSGLIHGQSNAPDLVRRQFYSLYYWHGDVKVADLGNIREGSLFTDSYAALRTVIHELINDGKTVIILG